MAVGTTMASEGNTSIKENHSMNGSSSKGYVVKSAVADKGNALSHPLFRPLGFNMRGCRNDMHVTMWLQLTICCINAVQASGGNGKQVSF
eukprot:s2578_g13.t1